MGVRYTAGYAAAAEYPLNHPRILWDPVAVSAVTSSGAAAGQPADRVLTPETSTWWESTVGGAVRTLTLDFGAAKAVDAVGVAGHNFGGDLILVEAATNIGLTTWTALDTFTPTDDSTLLLLVSPGAYFGLRFTITVPNTALATQVAAIYAGQALTLPVRGYGDVLPIDLGMATEVTNYRSETGQFLGRFVEFAGLQGKFMYTHLPEQWVRQYLVPFLKRALTKPFFIANRPQGYASEAAYAWTRGNVIPQRMKLKDFMSVMLEVDAHAPVTLF